MQITAFGLFWLIVLLIGCLKGQRTLIKIVLFSAMFQAGAVFIIAGKPISPLTVSCIVFIVDYLVRYKFKPKLLFPAFCKSYMLFWIVIFCEAIIASFAFVGLDYMEAKDWVSYVKYDGHVALFGLFTLLIYGSALLFAYNLKCVQFNDIEKLIDVMVVFVFVVGIWHFGTVMNYIPRNDFIRDFIYSNSTTTDSIAYFTDTNINLRIYRSIFGIRFCGPFMEPSYCAGFLAMAFAFYVGKPELKAKDMLLIVAVLIMAVLTYSATAYITVTFAGVTTAVLSGKVKQLIKIAERGLVLIAIALVVITRFELWDTVQRLIINKAETHSAYIRGLWNINAMGTFLDTYGLGMGYSNVRGSSLLCTIPASCGFIGTVCFVIFIVTVTKYNSSRRHSGQSQVKYQIMFLSTLFAMLVAISTLDYSIFWMSAILLVLHKQNYEIDKPACSQSVT